MSPLEVRWLILGCLVVYFILGCAFTGHAVHSWGADLSEPRERRAVVTLWPVFVCIALLAWLGQRVRGEL